MTERKILLTNDDGVHHVGLQTLYKFLKEKFDVTVCAPNKNWSSSGCALTIFDAIKLFKVDDKVFAISGTPADSVVLGIGLFSPDVVISGPNPHPTVGPDIFRSSTLAAAIQAAYLGVPSLAVSIYSEGIGTSFKNKGSSDDYLVACEVAAWVVKAPWFKRAPCWNLNVHSAARSFDDIILTKCAVKDFGDRFIEIGEDCRGERWYRLTYTSRINNKEKVEKLTDVDALRRKKISLTPLSLDLTNYEILKRSEDKL